MNASGWLMSLLVVGLLVVAPGCQNPPPSDVEGLADANNDGFGDVIPPDGVDFDHETSLKIGLTNTIDIDDVATLAEAYGVDPGLLGFATITINITVTLDYGAGVTDVLEDSKTIAPFDTRIEVACPISTTVGMTVTAQAPVVGTQVIFEGEFELVEGVDYECGETLGFEAFINDDGFPEIQPLETE